MVQRSDEQIKNDVIDELFWDTRVDQSRLEVSVCKGVVSLTGQVPSFSDLIIARVAPWRIDGVKDVIDTLVINYDLTPEIPTDEEIQERVQNIIIWEPVIDETDVNTYVIDGVVTLGGVVDQYWKKAFIEERISSIRGVVRIENKLSVVPTKKVSDELIAKEIVAALNRDILVDAEDVTVEVDNGSVTLSGVVPRWTAKEAIQRDVSRTTGGMHINNQLTMAGR